MPPSAGGGSLGNATGTVTIQANQVQQAAAQVQQASNQMTTAFAQVNAASNQAQAGMTALSNAARQLAGSFGIGLSIGGIGQLAKFIEDANATAVAFDRQSLAARNLAGNQQQLNNLMAVYDEVTGGAVNQTEQLQAVTKLLSLGFADSSEELERFATAIRGISIATGRAPEDVTQRLTLELFSQQGRRLDELGLQYDKVRQAAAQLQAANKELTDSEAYQIAVLDQAVSRFGGLVGSTEGAASGVEKLHRALSDLVLLWGRLSETPLGLAGSAFQGEVNLYITALEKLQRAFEDFVDNYIRSIQVLNRLGVEIPGLPATLTFEQERAVQGRAGADTGHRDLPPPPEINPNQDKIDEAWHDRFHRMDQITVDSNRQVEAENTSYEQRRLRMVEQYNQSVGDSAAQFAKQAMRDQEDYEDAILDIMSDGQREQERLERDHNRQMERMARDHAERLADLDADLARNIDRKRQDSAEKTAEMAEDLDDAIADRRQASAKRLAEIEEDYQKDREHAAEDHYDKLSNAAARLDANAVFEENRRFARENRQASEKHDEKVQDEEDRLQEAIDNLNESYAKRLEDEKKALDKSIDQANEAHDLAVQNENKAYERARSEANEAYALQLEDQQAANGVRLEDLKTAYGKEKGRKDEDQVDRLNQMADHHTQDLTQLDAEHTERLTQISTHAQDERNEYDSEFKERLHQLGVHNGAWDKAQEVHDHRMSLSHSMFYAAEEKALAESERKRLNLMLKDPDLDPLTRTALTMAVNSLNTEIGNISWVLTEAQKTFDALPKDPYNFVPDVVGGQGTATISSISAQGLIAQPPTSSGVVSGSSISIGDVTIHLGDIGNRSDTDVKQLVSDALLEALQDVASLSTNR